jgi:hypothetical protein
VFHFSDDLWVSNSSSRGERELDEVPAVRDPRYSAEIDRRDPVSIGERQGRIAFQGRMPACRVSPHRPDEPLDERV